MVDYRELMQILSVPRPNGSAALEATRLALQAWLDRRKIPYCLHEFRLYPFFFETIGLWILLSRTLLVLAVALRWGWAAIPIALLGLAGGLVDVAFGLPLVSWPGARTGRSLLIPFDPPGGSEDVRQELVLSAHYDSKTELLDHRQRMFFLRSLRIGMLLSLLLAVLGPLDRALLAAGSPLAPYSYALGLGLSLPLLFLAWGLGLNLSVGRLRPPSQGAVDNGTSCAVLLGLAARLSAEASAGAFPLCRTRLTLALFGGEEVNMQGSRAYVQDRDWPLPAANLNLEVLAQDGEYVFWELDGFSLKLLPTSPALNAASAAAVREVTGEPARPAGPVNSDGGSFLLAGLPSTTLGTYCRTLRDRGFHLPSDNIGRVVPARLPEAVEILRRFIHKVDREGINPYAQVD